MTVIQVNIAIQFYEEGNDYLTKTSASFELDLGDDPGRKKDKMLRNMPREFFNGYTNMALCNKSSSLNINRIGDVLNVNGVGKANTRKEDLQGALDRVADMYNIGALTFVDETHS